MTRHHMTPDGPIPFTAQEETDWNAREKEFVETSVNLAWITVRKQRNQLLADCDWTQLPDAPLTNVQTAAWAIYRQALRDITTQADPFNIIWPDQPTA